MGKFSDALMDGGADLKQQRMFNYLIELLETGYVVEGLIDNINVRVEITPAGGLSFYQGDATKAWTYRGGLGIIDGELTLATDIMKDPDNEYAYMKFQDNTDDYSSFILELFTGNAYDTPTDSVKVGSLSGWYQATGEGGSDHNILNVGLSAIAASDEESDLYLQSGYYGANNSYSMINLIGGGNLYAYSYMKSVSTGGEVQVNLNSGVLTDQSANGFYMYNADTEAYAYYGFTTDGLYRSIDGSTWSKYLTEDVDVPIIADGTWNRGTWNTPTDGALTQIIDTTSNQHSVLVGRTSGGTRYYGMDLLDSTSDPTMRIYVGAGYLQIQPTVIGFNGNAVFHAGNCAWASWSPSITYYGGATNPTSTSVAQARYVQFGKTVMFFLKLNITRGSGDRSQANITLPVNRSATYNATTPMSFTHTLATRGVNDRAYSDSETEVKCTFSTMTADGYIAIEGFYESA